MKTKTKSGYTSQVMVTFTPQQKKDLENYTQKKGLSMASFIRFQVLKELDNQTNQIPNTTTKNKLAKFAGSLKTKDADKMITDIYKNRSNKK
jgi:hypothetical protein